MRGNVVQSSSSSGTGIMCNFKYTNSNKYTIGLCDDGTTNALVYMTTDYGTSAVDSFNFRCETNKTYAFGRANGTPALAFPLMCILNISYNNGAHTYSSVINEGELGTMPPFLESVGFEDNVYFAFKIHVPSDWDGTSLIKFDFSDG